MTFAAYTYLRPTPLPRAEADDSRPEVLTQATLDPAASRPRARRLYSLVALLGFVTYGFGLPAAICVWLG